jgi:hypothetical protein
MNGQTGISIMSPYLSQLDFLCSGHHYVVLGADGRRNTSPPPFEDNIIGHLSNGLGDVDEAQESYDFRPLRFGRPVSLVDPYSC